MENRFKDYRKKRGFTQEQMAQLLSVSRQTYINYESGAAEPSFKTLLDISRILRTPIDDLLNNEFYPSNRDRHTLQIIEELENVIKKYK